MTERILEKQELEVTEPFGHRRLQNNKINYFFLSQYLGDLQNNIDSLRNVNEKLTDDLKNEGQKVVDLKESLDNAEQKTKDELASQRQRLVVLSVNPEKPIFSFEKCY